MSKRINSVDPNLTLTLAHCANEAYYPTRHNPPANFKYYTTWYGRNPSYFGGDVEPYGLVFQGSLPSNAGTFIFAFKGTATWWDAWEDIFINWASFVSYHNSRATNQVDVADGFNAVYTAPVTPGHNDSMQEQLMNILHRIQPKEVVITGHSLGSALAELFSLDIYLSYPNRLFTTKHYNFACPRVGFSAFANLYNKLESTLPSISQTIRMVNYKDEIPCVPWNFILGYEHAPEYFLISFDKASGLPDYITRHSMYNYWQVLKKVVVNSPQVYTGPVTGIHGVPLQSAAPSPGETECSLWYAAYLEEMAAKIRKASEQEV